MEPAAKRPRVWNPAIEDKESIGTSVAPKPLYLDDNSATKKAKNGTNVETAYHNLINPDKAVTLANLAAWQQVASATLSSNATFPFLLQNYFEMAPALIHAQMQRQQAVLERRDGAHSKESRQPPLFTASALASSILLPPPLNLVPSGVHSSEKNNGSSLSSPKTRLTASLSISPPPLLSSASSSNSPPSNTKPRSAPLKTSQPLPQTIHQNPLVQSALGVHVPNENCCAICGAAFRLTGDLVQHMRSNHRRSRFKRKSD